MVRRAPPAFRAPQLATLTDSVPLGDDWLFEMKFDGYRCLAAVAGKVVRLYTRSGKDWTDQFGRVAAEVLGLPAEAALLDGEVCALDENGRSDFALLRERLSTGGDLVYIAFDLLELDGRDLTREPLLQRKERLEQLLSAQHPGSAVRYANHLFANGQYVLEALCHDGFEGVIAKRIDAPYRGRRTRDWLKVKCSRRQEFVIVGWSPSSRRNTFASLLLATHERGILTYRGRVGTGFSESTLEQIQALLDGRKREGSPVAKVPRAVERTARWVTPDQVAEVSFTEFTRDGLLRHPAFVSLRTDKPAKQVVRERSLEPGVRLTSPYRVVYPGQGVTKSALADYYAEVGAQMLPFIARRPLSLLRCPQGRTRTCFFQKHDSGGFPPQMHTSRFAEKDGTLHEYFHVDSVDGLLAGTQMNVLEWHQWGACVTDVERPERLVFDLDPDEALGFDHVRLAALTIAELLERAGLRSFPMLTGGKGVHVIVPILPDATWSDAKTFSSAVAHVLAEQEPDRFVATMSKARRRGRLFIDYLRNERGATAVTPWSTRAREGAPVAMPVSWDELMEATAANVYSLETAMARAQRPPAWPDYWRVQQSLARAMRSLLGA